MSCRLNRLKHLASVTPTSGTDYPVFELMFLEPKVHDVDIGSCCDNLKRLSAGHDV